jgi:hypothetical protein
LNSYLGNIFGRDLSKLELFSHNGKAFGSRALGLDRGRHRPRIGLDCAQRVGDILNAVITVLRYCASA